MECFNLLLSGNLSGMLVMPSSPLHSCLVIKRRVAASATHNPMAPAFGQNVHSRSRDTYRREDPATFAQDKSLEFAEEPHQGEVFPLESPPSSTSPLSFPLQSYPTAPAFGQNVHSRFRDTYLREDPATFAQHKSLEFAEKPCPGELFTLESPSPSTSPLSFPLQNSAEDSTFDLASYFRSPEKIATAHEALQTLILGQDRPRLSEREEWLIRTLKKRREIVKELLMGALKSVRLGPKFSSAVISSMPDFVDLVMIKAAALKKMPEHVHAPFSFRARLYIEQAAVGKKVRWLKHHRFTFSKIARLLFMVENHESSLHPKIKWLKSINLTGRDLAAALTRDPIILEKSIHELGANVQLLRSAGVRPDWIGVVLRRSSKILACSKEELSMQIELYNSLGIEGDTFGKMVYNFPACLGRFSLDEMCNKLEYLRGFGLDDLTLGQVLAEKPQLIACSIEEDWKPLTKLFYFLGIDGCGIRKILKVKPSVFCLNLKDNIAPKIRFLKDVGVREEDIGDVLVKFPAILSYSLDKKIKPCVMFLLEKAAVPIIELGKVLSLQPDLIGCSIKNRLDIAVRFFIYHGFKRQQVGQMVSDFPMLLRYSVSSMKPKLSYAFRVMKLQVDEVVKFPRLFSYSLELRIVPRYKILKSRGLNYSLRKMLARPDEEFLQSLDEQDKDDSEGSNELLDAPTNCKAHLLNTSSDMSSQGTAGQSLVGKSADLDMSEAGLHIAFTGMREDVSESSWPDMSVDFDMAESSWHTISEAEEDTDVMFDDEDSMSDKDWQSTFYTEGISDSLYEDVISDTRLHSQSAVYQIMNEQQRA